MPHSTLVNATDPRDHVFAYLSLLPPGTQHGVPINYETSQKEILTRAMRHILFTSQSLNTLSYAGRQSLVNSSGVPSWVTEWQRDSLSMVDFGDKIFSAASVESWYGTDQGDIFTLKVSSCKVDTVKVLAPKPAKEESNTTSEVTSNGTGAVSSVKHTFWKLAEDEVRSQFDNETAFIEALGRAVFSDCLPTKNRRVNGNDTESIIALIRNLTDANAMVPTMRAGTEEWSKALEIEREVSITYKNSLFGVTAAGRMGLFPKQVEEGDEIILIASANRPFVVRKVQSSDQDTARYKLVGPCYVQGIMDGEALDGTWEQIVLV